MDGTKVMGKHLVDKLVLINFYTNSGYIYLQIEPKMARNTSILLGNYFDKLISEQVESGRFSSASEVERTALHFFEEEENKKVTLVRELQKGEKSGFVQKSSQL
ncbi:MAG: type II toxin-antitoxin system ParD family antitoxin [bacterium]|nr:type II toxin-antitoxin system ParD family antitoxin [bacterium]